MEYPHDNRPANASELNKSRPCKGGLVPRAVRLAATVIEETVIEKQQQYDDHDKDGEKPSTKEPSATGHGSTSISPLFRSTLSHAMLVSSLGVDLILLYACLVRLEIAKYPATRGFCFFRASVQRVVSDNVADAARARSSGEETLVYADPANDSAIAVENRVFFPTANRKSIRKPTPRRNFISRKLPCPGESGFLFSVLPFCGSEPCMRRQLLF